MVVSLVTLVYVRLLNSFPYPIRVNCFARDLDGSGTISLLEIWNAPKEALIRIGLVAEYAWDSSATYNYPDAKTIKRGVEGYVCFCFWTFPDSFTQEFKFLETFKITLNWIF